MNKPANITLREYAAVMAMQGLLSTGEEPYMARRSPISLYSAIAVEAVKHADHLLSALKQERPRTKAARQNGGLGYTYD